MHPNICYVEKIRLKQNLTNILYPLELLNVMFFYSNPNYMAPDFFFFLKFFFWKLIWLFVLHKFLGGLQKETMPWISMNDL